MAWALGLLVLLGTIVLLVIIGYLWEKVFGNQRTLNAIAHEIGFSCEGSDSQDRQHAPNLNTALFRKGYAGGKELLMTGSFAGLRASLFDYSYLVDGPDGESITRHATVAAYMKDGICVPEFAWGPMPTRFFGDQYYQEYYDQGGKGWETFSAELRSFLQTLDSRKRWHLEGIAETLIVFRKGVRKEKRVKAADLRMFLEESSSIAASFFKLCGFNKMKGFLEIVKTGYPQDVQAAINEGADLEARDMNGATALMWAVTNTENLEMITTLLKAGADVNARDKNGATVLMLAAVENQNPLVITALLQSGADLKTRGGNGATALIYAAKWNQNPEAITTLLKAGADAKARDSGGKTAFDYAKHNEKLIGTEALSQLLTAQEESQLAAASIDEQSKDFFERVKTGTIWFSYLRYKQGDVVFAVGKTYVSLRDENVSYPPKNPEDWKET